MFWKRQIKTRKPNRTCRLTGCETLERREVMAANLMATFDGLTLRIEGTDRADQIVVNQVNDQVSVSGISITQGSNKFASIKASSIQRITVDALGGNDQILLNSQDRGGQAIQIAATVRAGSGNDKVIGTAAADYIYGNANDDVLDGADGNDVVHGDTGADKLYGRNGNDWLYGGSGKDKLYGGNNDDMLSGESGADKLYGEGGNDDLYGGDGDDYLEGGAGSDELWGGGDFNEYNDNFDLKKPIVNGAKPGDIDQDGSPLCQTGASLAAAADQGFNFGKLISYKGNGNYDVTVWNNGKKTTVRVQFDGTWSDNDLSPGRDKDGNTHLESWTIIMQRARMKMLGIKQSEYDEHLSDSEWNSLNKRTGSRLFDSQDALRTFTGQKVSAGAVVSADPEKLRKSIKDGRMIVGSTLDTGGKKVVDAKTGLVGSHAYAVLNVFKKSGKWMVDLYNPWASDSSSGAITGANDGFLTISWKQFSKNFDAYYVA